MNEDFNLEPAVEPVTSADAAAAPNVPDAPEPGNGDGSGSGGGGSTGLAWPRTWRGAYVLVMCSFVLWVAALIALSEVFK